MIPALRAILFAYATALPKPEELDCLLPAFAEVMRPRGSPTNVTQSVRLTIDQPIDFTPFAKS